MGIYKIKPNARKYSCVANNEVEFCKFTGMHLTDASDWFKNNQLLSELTYAHYREPVPLTRMAFTKTRTLKKKGQSRKKILLPLMTKA